MRLLATFLILLILCAPLSEAQAGLLSCRDKMGRTVAIKTPVRRAVLFETYELLPVTGAWDRVAGLSRYAFGNDLLLSANPAALRAIPDAGSAMDSNAETLLRLKPDLVLTWSVNPDAVRFLERKGLTVIAVYPESIAELYDVMRLQGKLFGREKRVEAAINRMEEVFALIRKRVAGIPPSRRKKAIYLTGKQTRVNGRVGVTHDLFRLMGLENGGAGIDERSREVPLERIISWNPDLIYIWGSARYTAADLKNNPQWRHIRAVKSGMVFKEPTWGTWSPRLAPMALWMAAKAYPERFRDLNIDTAIDRFYRQVYGIPYARARRIEG
jgi:iron complex transport system substrate-binding protein